MTSAADVGGMSVESTSGRSVLPSGGWEETRWGICPTDADPHRRAHAACR